MKYLPKCIYVLLASIALLLTGYTAKADDFNAAASHAIAVEASTGKILYEKDATSTAGIASITKILTVYLVYKQIDEGKLKWDDQVAISDYAYNLTANSDASNVPMEARSYSVKQLVNAAMIASANSAAIALAEKIGGTEAKFVDMMSAQLKSWGITDAHLVNASGLNNSYLGNNIYPSSSATDENTMSALDVAIIARHLITEYPDVLKITSQSSLAFDDTTTLQTYNEMLPGMSYTREGVDGLKTGTTELAGASFVATTSENDMRIITVVLHADNADTNNMARFSATNDLMNYVYSTWKIQTLVKKGTSYNKSQAKVTDGKQANVAAVAQKDFKVITRKNDTNAPKLSIKTKTLEAPVKKGKEAGTLTFEDTDLVGTGYLEKTRPQVKLITKSSVKRSMFLKVWWNHFVNWVNTSLTARWVNFS